jgi:hypothetical protein
MAGDPLRIRIDAAEAGEAFAELLDHALDDRARSLPIHLQARINRILHGWEAAVAYEGGKIVASGELLAILAAIRAQPR